LFEKLEASPLPPPKEWEFDSLPIGEGWGGAVFFYNNIFPTGNFLLIFKDLKIESTPKTVLPQRR
jgi:hypothetical protein